jgi:hypothetical protein
VNIDCALLSAALYPIKRNAFGGHVIEDLPFFLLSYGSFGLAVSEKKIFLEIN